MTRTPAPRDPFDIMRRATCYYDLGATLALIGLIGALLTVGGLAYDKYASDQGIAALERMRDALADRVAEMEDEGEPGYRVRLARAQLDMADKIVRRARAGDRVLLDQKGVAATQDALLNLVKGQLFSDIMALGDLAFDSTVKLNRAYAGDESDHQRRLRDKVDALRERLQATGDGDARPLQGDDLDFFIAAAEVNHISRVVQEEQGIREDDPVFVNVLRRYVDDYYLRPGERPLPREIRGWVDTIVATRFETEPERPPEQPAASGYLVWIHYWPSCHNVGLDSLCDMPHPTRAEGRLVVGSVEEWDEIRSGGAGSRYRDDRILASLVGAAFAMFSPKDVTLDSVLDARIHALVLTVEDPATGKQTVPRFDTRAEAIDWVCARLKDVSRRDTLGWVGMETRKTVPYTLATFTDPWMQVVMESAPGP